MTSTQSAVAGGDLDRLRQRRGVVVEVGAAGRATKTWLGRSVRKPTPSRRYCSVVISRGGSAAGPTPSTVPYRPCSGHPGDVGQPPGVRRPDRRPGAEVVVGQPAGRAAGGRQQPDLRPAAGLGAEVGQPAAVRGERRARCPGARTVSGRAGAEPSVGTAHSWLRYSSASRSGRRDRDHRHPAVRGDGRDAGDAQEREVVRPHGRATLAEPGALLARGRVPPWPAPRRAGAVRRPSTRSSSAAAPGLDQAGDRGDDEDAEDDRQRQPDRDRRARARPARRR